MSDFLNYKTLDLETDHDWLTIWFNRPKVRNALSREMIEELLHLFSALKDRPDIRGVTLRGRGGIFCAGGDIKEFKSLLQGETKKLEDVARASRRNGELFGIINETPQVVIMLVEGAAMAGGMGIVCCGDVVVVTEDAKFALTETSIGIPPAQIAPFVAARLGSHVARRLMLTAGRFDGAEAVKIGLADYVAKDVDHMNGIEIDIKKRVRKCAAGANAVTKNIILATRYAGRTEMIDIAGAGFAKCMLSDEGREGVASFLEKRKPYWAIRPTEKEA